MDQYRPDDDASPFDVQLMGMAQALVKAGHEDDAETVASAAAELREFHKQNPYTPTKLCAALEMVQGAAASVMEVIGRNFPPPSK